MSEKLPEVSAESPAVPSLLHVNVFFRLAAGLVVMFVITIFAMIANLLGNPKAPVAQFLDKYALHLIVLETIGILVTGMLAMTIDKSQSPPSGVTPTGETQERKSDSQLKPHT